MATVRRLPSGRWRAETYDHGKRRSYTADTKKEAERLAAVGLEEERAKERAGMTVADALSAYIETCKAQGYSPSTIKEYTARRKNSYTAIEGARLDRLKAQDVQAQLDARINEGKAVKTVRNDWFLLRATLNTFAPNIDLRRIRIAKKPKRAKIVFRREWASEILREARDRWGKDDFYLYALFIICAGLRPSEAYALRWEDISHAPVIGLNGIRAGTISIHAAEVEGVGGQYVRKAPKTAAGVRLISVPWSLVEELERIRPREDGRIIQSTPRLATRRWGRLRALLALPDSMRFYDLRHFYATSIVESGASEEELAARMGHSTSAFSHSVYVEIFEERQAAINASLFAASEAIISG